MRLDGMPFDDEARAWSKRWLTLAVVSVALSGIFAILIALARVPALGNLFPGADFYRVALVLHVNLSQGVWFMAFACALWALLIPQRQSGLSALALVLCTLGMLGLVASLSTGALKPLMSNYLPVLDSPIFLWALASFGAGVLLQATLAAPASLSRLLSWTGGLPWILVALSVISVVLLMGLLMLTYFMVSEEPGLHFYESLFWGPGHLWQFVLTSLLMHCWITLSGKQGQGLNGVPSVLVFGLNLVPIVLGLLVPFVAAPGGAGSATLYTWLMQWSSWQAPLLLAVLLVLRGGCAGFAPGFYLSLFLFVAGLLIGTLIDGQTTLVTAHYHGTIGAITLAFMAVSYRLLNAFGTEVPDTQTIRWQLGFYGYGILLMMTGLAGAGLMGAPRKTPGDLSVSFGIETISRIFLGIGGLLATIGIVMFAYLMLPRLLSPQSTEALSL